MKNTNRTIENLRKSLNGKVYLYFESSEICAEFLKDAEEEGYLFGERKPTQVRTDNILALLRRKQLCYVGIIGRIAYQSAGAYDDIHRIDYAKYRSGADDYRIETLIIGRRKEKLPEDQAFIKRCDSFSDYANIDEYKADICRWLMLSSWHYTREEAEKVMNSPIRAKWIEEAFQSREPAADIAADVGHLCD